MPNTTRAISRRAFLGMQALCLSGALIGCSQGDGGQEPVPAGPRTLDQIRTSGQLDIGMCSDNKPLSFINSRGAYDGPDQYFGLHLAGQLRVAPHYVSLDPGERYDALADGTVDVVLAQMSPDDDRSEEVALTAPLYRLGLGVVSPKGALVESAEQLVGIELIACAGSFAHQFAASVWPGVSLRTYETLSDTYAALEQGFGGALIADEISIAAWVKKSPDFALGMTALDEPRPIAPAVAWGQDDLLAVVEEAVSTFISYGYRSRSYTSDVVPFVGNDYASLFA
ncbi:MAG: transporter substrate-binding domain-containing protein [Atopobiaceae bacterium]|nr:transporter substrate-binding domain-containing protein [Atopobiaceae bacterium]